jgi:hypothetical protein
MSAILEIERLREDYALVLYECRPDARFEET